MPSISYNTSQPKRKERVSYAEKYKNKQQWFKDYIDYISLRTLSEEDKIRMKVNYDLYNNIIVKKEFDYICKPFGDNIKALPITMQNRDIVSGKIKTLLGMEMQRPFSYRVFSVNSEATTQKEKKEFDMMREYVISQIMQPIEEQLNQQAQQELQNLSPEQQQDPNTVQQIQQSIEEQKQQLTPPEIKKYMMYEYQDPAETLSSQLLAYLQNKLNIKAKFSTMFKNALLTARSIMYVGILNDEPELFIVNPMRFNYAKSSDTEFIEDSEWAVCEYRMSPSQIVKYFSKELSASDIDRIYKYSASLEGVDPQDLFIESTTEENETDISVYHCVWKSLRKIGFLTYIDEEGNPQQEIVDEHYTLTKDVGDIQIDWEWIPEVYEGWKINIGDGIYVNMRPLPGQYKDLDNLYHCKLPYYGTIYDSYNSVETSLMDRIKFYQYFYNVVMYRLETLMASDKGKKLLMNINNIPDSLGIDLSKWQYFAESSPYVWFNSAEEGAQTQDAGTVAKVLDLSLVSDIKKYIEIAEYIKQQCGKSVGITEQVEGQIGQYEAVRNTNQALIQSSYILEYYFQTHDQCKVNILTALLETAKICYAKSQPKKLSYILDDLSVQLINVDPVILDNSTLGIFISSSSKAEQIRDLITQLSHAALQNQTVDFSDIISVINAESVPEAEAILKQAQQRRDDQQQAMQKQQQEFEKQMQEQALQARQQEFEMQKELTVLKEEERRKTEIAKISIMGASYNPDHDADNDGINDFIELSKSQLSQFAEEEDLKLRRDEFAYKQQQDAIANNQKDKELSIKNEQAKYRAKKAFRPRL